MADELNFEMALTLARRLKSIDGFSFDEAVIVATAEDLVRWCKGAILDRSVWSAEEQAFWLVTEARENWTKWPGTAKLRELFRAKFTKVQQPAEWVPLSYQESMARGLVRPPCPLCDDGGYVGKRPDIEFCSCRRGRYEAKWQGDRGLQQINTAPVRKAPAVTAFTAITEDQMRQALEDAERRKKQQLIDVGFD